MHKTSDSLYIYNELVCGFIICFRYVINIFEYGLFVSLIVPYTLPKYKRSNNVNQNKR